MGLVADMIVGFAGSRTGMTSYQRQLLRYVLSRASEAHHGDCIGADAEFHELCEELGVDVVIHPPEDDTYRAWCHSTRIEEPRPYLQRNRDIVDASELLVAAPKDSIEPQQPRGHGTWHTARYARREAVSLLILWPAPRDDA